MSSFGPDENDHQDAGSIPTSVGTVRTDEDGVLAWSRLPAPVVEKIYSFLNRRDQMRMSSVCRSWREEYGSPSLWRRMEFPVSGLRDGSELCIAGVLARRYGAMFRHVEVSLHGPVHWYSASSVYRHMTLFCEAVARSSQLLSVSFRSLDLRCVGGPGTPVCQEILNLLKSQCRLRRVEFNLCHFEKAQAAEILNALFANNFETLRYLSLKHFYTVRHSEAFTDGTVDDGLNFLALLNLEILDVHYTQMFVYMMLSFYEYRNGVDMRERRGRLREIRLQAIHCENCDYVIIDPLVWDYFRKVFPRLGVALTLSCKCDSRTLDIFLVPNMPLKSLKFNLWDVQGGEIGSLLRHITSCELNESLEELVINWQHVPSNLAPDLINVTNACPKLKTLNLKILHPVEAGALDAVFDSWLENRPPSLDVVQITVVARDEKQIYAHLNDKYAPLLRALELHVSVLVRE